MNERIRELASQMFSMERFEYAEEFVNDEFMEKFAELIVAECLLTLDSIVCDTSGERDTLWIARKVIADHFGVEQ